MLKILCLLILPLAAAELPDIRSIPADLTFLCTGFRNHNDSWILLPSPAREKAREWLQRVSSSR